MINPDNLTSLRGKIHSKPRFYNTNNYGYNIIFYLAVRNLYGKKPYSMIPCKAHVTPKQPKLMNVYRYLQIGDKVSMIGHLEPFMMYNRPSMENTVDSIQIEHQQATDNNNSADFQAKMRRNREFVRRQNKQDPL